MEDFRGFMEIPGAFFRVCGVSGKFERVSKRLSGLQWCFRNLRGIRGVLDDFGKISELLDGLYGIS